MSEKEIRVLYVQPGKYPEERTIPNTLRALQELVGGDIECCRPWRDSVCVICNDSGKIDGLPPNRLYGHTDFLAGSFVVCGNGGEDFISLTDRQVFLYERLYHTLGEDSMHFILTKEDKYIWYSQTGRELYFNLRDDPHETKNALDENPERVAELRALLIDALKNREEQYTDGHTLFVGKTPLTVLQNTEVL